MSIGLRQRVARITENIHVLVTGSGIAMKGANYSKCLGVEINEFLTWDTHNEGDLFFFLFLLFFLIVNFVT